MQLLAAVLKSLFQSALVIAGLMAVLFIGYLAISQFGPAVKDGLETPQRLEELQEAGLEHAQLAAERQAEGLAHRSRRMTLGLRLQREQRNWEEQLEEELDAVYRAAEDQIAAMERDLIERRDEFRDSAGRLEDEYCDSWNPVNWWTCRALQQRIDKLEGRIDDQREAIEETAGQLREQADERADAVRDDAQERLEEQTAEFERRLDASLEAIDDLDAQRSRLDDRIEQIQAEERELRSEHWIWIEFRDRWPYLLAVAVLIFTAPYLRRTLWYFAGMPLVSRAEPIVLSESTGEDSTAEPDVAIGESRRILDVEIPSGGRLLAKSGYIQSDREGASSELFFDRDAPNLSFISGLVLLTRLESNGTEEPPRTVSLGTPDNPDAYLMRIDLENHPGVVLRARHVVAVIGDIDVDSNWRLANLHAWATSQVRFIVFSGTGSLIVEGFGDVRGALVEDEREQKRMPQVIGFDTRLSYSTQRSATFLPYLVDPGREPLVVDVFEGTGAVFFEKNPSERNQHRTAGEKIAGFFLDAFRRLLGL